jgi:hypothetical protein
MDDTVRSLEGKADLWTMLEAALTSTKSLANRDVSLNDHTKPVYFDILGIMMVVVRTSFFFTINLVLLITGPVLVISLLVLLHRIRQLDDIAAAWPRLPLALGSCSICTYSLCQWILSVNPHVKHSQTCSII